MLHDSNLRELIRRLAEVVAHKSTVQKEFPYLIEEVGEFATELAEGDDEKQAQELADVWLGATVMLQAFYPEFDPTEHLKNQIGKWTASLSGELPAQGRVYILAAITRFEEDGRPAEWNCIGGPTSLLYDLYATDPAIPDGNFRCISILRASGDRVEETCRWSRNKQKWIKLKPKGSHGKS